MRPLIQPGSRTMAANQRPGAFVLEVADLGKEVLSIFTKFVLSRKVRDHRLETLLANISITTSLLVDLGSTINKYENDYHVKDGLTKPICETCKADFEQLIVLANIAKEKGCWITEGVIGGKSVATEVDTFFIFDITLGIGEKAMQFWTRLNETRGTVDALNDMIKYKILKELNQQNRLEPKQIEELKHLTTVLPRMVLALESTEKMKRERLAMEEKEEKERDERLKLKEMGEKAPKTVKSSRKRPDVGEKDDFTEFIEKAEADALSEDTAIEADDDAHVDKGKTKKKKVKFSGTDDDSNSLSYDPYEKHLHSENKVVYEEWLLSFHGQKSIVRRSWGLLGLKVKEYDEETEYWDIEPELRSQSELKAAHENAASSTTESKYRSSIDKAIKALPQHARDLIDWLVEDRTEATNNEKFIRQWSVVAVRPKEKHVYRSGKKLVKSVKSTDWLIMIKGETLGSSERTRPDRWDDPWRKARPRRHYPRHYDRYDEPEYNRHRPHYEEYAYVPRPPARVVEEDRRYESESESEDDTMDDGFRSGMINVGVFTGQEDAEKRMDKILDDMAGKLRV